MNGIHEVTGSIPVWSTNLRFRFWFYVKLFELAGVTVGPRERELLTQCLGVVVVGLDVDRPFEEKRLVQAVQFVLTAPESRAPPSRGLAYAVNSRRRHSRRNATIGSTRVARVAGTQQASVTISENRTAAEPYVAGSRGVTPYNMLSRRRARNAAPPSPTSRPAANNPNPRRRINSRMARVSAPSAIRTPISDVRLATPYARTP